MDLAPVVAKFKSLNRHDSFSDGTKLLLERRPLSWQAFIIPRLNISIVGWHRKDAAGDRTVAICICG
jgi:hypothetical protein